MTRNHQKPEVVLRVLVDLFLNPHLDHFGSRWGRLWWWWWWLLLLSSYYQCWPELTDIFSDGSEPPTAALHLYSTPRAKLLLWRFTIGSIRYWIHLNTSSSGCQSWMLYMLDAVPYYWWQSNPVRPPKWCQIRIFSQNFPPRFLGWKIGNALGGSKVPCMDPSEAKVTFSNEFHHGLLILATNSQGMIEPQPKQPVWIGRVFPFLPSKDFQSSKILGSCKQKKH